MGETSDTWSVALTTELGWFLAGGEPEFNRKDEQGTVIVRYTLSDGGRTLTAVERLRSATQCYDNTWVFERQ